jgi:transposase
MPAIAANSARGAARFAAEAIDRKFDQDFKEGAVRLVRETGRPIAQVARDLGINEGIDTNDPCPRRISRAGSLLSYYGLPGRGESGIQRREVTR